MSFVDILRNIFTCFFLDHDLDSKICPLIWMEDSKKQKCIQFSVLTLPTYPFTLALPHLITKAIVFSAIIQCIQEFLHWNISYIHVQIFDPFNKICIITITNFTNNKSICFNSQKVPSLALLDWDWKNHVRPFYNGLYTQWWKNTHVTQVLKKHKVHLWKSLRLWLIYYLLLLTDDILSGWLAGVMLPPRGLKHTLQEMYIFLSKRDSLLKSYCTNYVPAMDTYTFHFKKSVFFPPQALAKSSNYCTVSHFK